MRGKAVNKKSSLSICILSPFFCTLSLRLTSSLATRDAITVLEGTARSACSVDINPVSYTHLRTKEPGSLGEPLYLDVATTLREAGMNDVVLVGGR